MSEIVIEVFGTPAPQGSKSRDRHGNMYESSAAVKPWREVVKWAALQSKSSFLRRPVAIQVDFFLRRPKGHYGTGRNAAQVKLSAPRWPAGKPDLDKLLRSTLDGLTGIAYDDDAQVVHVEGVKRYAVSAGLSGAVIRIREVTG